MPINELPQAETIEIVESKKMKVAVHSRLEDAEEVKTQH